MSDDAYGATIAKRRLARQLTAARIRSGYTANHACDILNWGRGKVGRFEANQWKRPEMSDIRDLIRIYGIEGDEKDEIEDLAIRARARPWWRSTQRSSTVNSLVTRTTPPPFGFSCRWCCLAFCRFPPIPRR